MRRNFKYVLAGLNVVVASCLLATEYLFPSTTGVSLGRLGVRLCNWINVPAALIRNSFEALLHSFVVRFCASDDCSRIRAALSVVVFLSAVGIVWYIVGVRLESQPAQAIGRRLRLFRLFTAPIIIMFGIFVAMVGVAEARSVAWYSWAKAVLIVLPYLIWSLAIIFSYAHSFLRNLRSKSGLQRDR